MMMKKVVPILLLACLVFSSYGAIMCSVGLTKDSLDTAAPDKKPVVFWKSQPVLPNDTVYVQGHLLDEKSEIEYAELKGPQRSAPKKPYTASDWRKIRFKTIGTIEPVGSSVKFTLPKSSSPEKYKSYAFRIKRGNAVSETQILNAPEVWWVQGTGGTNKGEKDEWLRVNGSCLDFGRGTKAVLRPQAGGKDITLKYVKGTIYSTEFRIPKNIKIGKYDLYIHNGLGGSLNWSRAIGFDIVKPIWSDKVFDIREFMDDPTATNGIHTPGIVYRRIINKETDEIFKRAIKAAGDNGGGIVYIPKGRYHMNETLVLPPYVRLKGQHQNLVTLDWGDREVPLPALVSGTIGFGVEDLSILAGNHKDGISVHGRRRVGRGNIRIRRVTLKLDPMSPVTRRNFSEEQIKNNYQKRLWVPRRSAAIRLSGENLEISDCTIMTVPSAWEASAIYLERARGAYINRNKALSSLRTSLFMNGVEDVVFTENDITGGTFIGTHHTVIAIAEDVLAVDPGDGTFVEKPFVHTETNNYYLNKAVRNIYIAKNNFKYALISDSEILTLDSHFPQGIYYGKIDKVQSNVTWLAKDTDHPEKWGERWPDLNYWAGAGLYIVDGKGAGQYRTLQLGSVGRAINLDSPWDVEPDETSIISIAKFHGRIIWEKNAYHDGGIFQLWAGSLECVVSGNTFTRTGGIISKSGHIYNGLMPDWYTQFFDNIAYQAGGMGTTTYDYTDDGVRGGIFRRIEPNPKKLQHMAGSIDDLQLWVSEPAYKGPIARGAIHRRNTHHIGTISVSGGVDGAVVEHNRSTLLVTDGASGIAKPKNVFVRDNETEEGAKVWRECKN